MRVILQFVYDVIAGAVAHLILMIFGLVIAMVVFGKMDEGLIHLVLCVVVPFACAGMFIAHRGVCFAPIVSFASGAVALLVPPIVIASHWNWNWAQIGPDYIWSIIGLPFSVAGSYYVRHTASKRQRELET